MTVTDHIQRCPGTTICAKGIGSFIALLWSLRPFCLTHADTLWWDRMHYGETECLKQRCVHQQVSDSSGWLMLMHFIFKFNCHDGVESGKRTDLAPSQGGGTSLSPQTIIGAGHNYIRSIKVWSSMIWSQGWSLPHNYISRPQLHTSMESQTVLFDSRRCTMVRQDALWWNWMSQAKMRASTSLRQFWLTHADTLHFQIVSAPMWLHRLWLPVTGNRKGLYRPKAGRTHQPGSQRMQSLLLEPAGHPWADLECKSCPPPESGKPQVTTDSSRAKGLRGTSWNRNFTSVFGDRTSFRAKQSTGNTKSQFYRSFWRSNLISCEKVARDKLTSQFYRSFWRSNLISCERVARDKFEIAILPQFLAIEPHFVRKGCAGQVEIAILPQFLAIEPHFVWKGCVSCRLVATAHQLDL